jgi:CheY-like chemotaxis protein
MTLRTLLVVEDDSTLSIALARRLPQTVRDLRVLLAEDGAMALEVLQAQPADLLLTDLDMPVMDGFELIARLSETRPALPVIVMTGSPVAAVDERLQSLQPADVLRKPLDLPALAALVEERLSRAREGLLRGVSLAGFLQLLGIEKRTGTLRIASGQGKAAIFLSGGQPVSIERDGQPGGEDLAYEVLVWPDARLGFEPGQHGRARTLRRDATELLLEACRLDDERRRAQGGETLLAPPGRSPRRRG